MKPGRENAAGIHIGAGLSGYVAELCASIVGADLGLPPQHLDNHASYIGHWLKVLRADSRALFAIVTKAETAASFLLTIPTVHAEPSLAHSTLDG